LAQRDTEIEQVRTQYEAAAQQLQAAQEMQANWQADIAQREATLTQVQQALAQTREQFAALQAERAQWQAQQMESTQTLTAMRQELAQLKQALETDRQERQEDGPIDQEALRQEIAALKQELSQASARQQEGTTAQTALRTEVDERQHEVQQLRQSLQTATDERTILHTQLVQSQAAAEAARTERDRCAAQQTETDQTLAATQQELHQVRAALDATRQQLNQQQGRRWESTAQTRKIKEQMSQQLQEAIQDNVVTLQQDAGQLRIRVGGHVLFNPGATVLRPDGRQTLDRIATVLQNYPGYEIQVEGHTDNDPVTNPDRKCWPTNWELSALRAASTVRYLETQNITSERLFLNGFSYYRPLASNDTEQGRAQNRRIEITIHPAQR
jgi:chemotaxis protein MotB